MTSKATEDDYVKMYLSIQENMRGRGGKADTVWNDPNDVDIDDYEAWKDKIDGVTPLMNAVKDGRSWDVQQLVANGADFDHRDIFGRTSLILATFLGQTSCVEQLLKCGDTTLAAKCNQDWTATTLAASLGHLEILKLLLNARKEAVRYRELECQQALRIAVHNNQILVAKELVRRAIPDEHSTNVRCSLEKYSSDRLIIGRQQIFDAMILDIVKLEEFSEAEFTKLLDAAGWGSRAPYIDLGGLGFSDIALALIKQNLDATRKRLDLDARIYELIKTLDFDPTKLDKWIKEAEWEKRRPKELASVTAALRAMEIASPPSRPPSSLLQL